MITTIEELESELAASAKRPLARYRFSGPFFEKVSSNLHAIYFRRHELGISMEVDLRDGGLLALAFSSADTGFVQTYRDEASRIQKRFVKEILTTSGIMSGEEAQAHKEFYRKATRDLLGNARALIDDTVAMVDRSAPYLIEHQSELFGMSQIEGVPANFYR